MGQWADIPSNVVTLHLELQLLESRFLCFLLLDSAASCTMTFVVSIDREQCSIAGILAACVLMLINQLLPITWTGWTCLRLPLQLAPLTCRKKGGLENNYLLIRGHFLRKYRVEPFLRTVILDLHLTLRKPFSKPPEFRNLCRILRNLKLGFLA
ncbi:hypothetical protein TNIN_79781 [Trichonephila inaurata madagascariensis]|uniref:Uncharacterized protein n=1 Tax=Trichonephila inaurata madagascariensis TaxID=2747483 RepID=A0A8X6X5J9_9ARAC|nr:hypothetical protein TNIN_79781 [Trichonephila inaurata madagascariensis]